MNTKSTSEDGNNNCEQQNNNKKQQEQLESKPRSSDNDLLTKYQEMYMKTAPTHLFFNREHMSALMGFLVICPSMKQHKTKKTKLMINTEEKMSIVVNECYNNAHKIQQLERSFI